MESTNQGKTLPFLSFGEGFRRILGLFSGILRYITLFYGIFPWDYVIFPFYYAIYYIILRYFILIFDSMISYLRAILRDYKGYKGYFK